MSDGPRHPAILASDAEREATVDRLRQAVVEGRLAFCSRLVRSGPWEIPARSSYRCLFGTIHLDLGQARLAGPEVEIEIINLFGTVTLIVPDGVRVSVQGGGAFASQVIHPPEAPPMDGAPVLRIRTSGPGGTLYVRNQRPRPNRRAKLLGQGDPDA